MDFPKGAWLSASTCIRSSCRLLPHWDLDRLDCFSDYYEDAMVDDNLPELEEQILRLCSQTPPSELLDFLNQLSDLIRHAVAIDLPLHCIAD